ncbi:hypothetical protein PVAP13_3KG282600 [Panicum virgatum]|uniref:Uncharacterized protein n=1 Tax=Panicum virgatum TaxID=38727 RepID=A0A8T0UY42_PANVG|nr:hypothetical protein PVAP13_3KG282600 [Panicum virgatum]
MHPTSAHGPGGYSPRTMPSRSPAAGSSHRPDPGGTTRGGKAIVAGPAPRRDQVGAARVVRCARRCQRHTATSRAGWRHRARAWRRWLGARKRVPCSGVGTRGTVRGRARHEPLACLPGASPRVAHTPSRTRTHTLLSGRDTGQPAFRSVRVLDCWSSAHLRQPPEGQALGISSFSWNRGKIPRFLPDA